ncbi:hypothetical protein DFJ58DRAFT_846254 [Suillus subalutaceus]|uniref:uncharacterized protein n=1 Tax=Suillus subalutaceus TaxID=48586 RepID=UPI001B87EB4C|nr:uncharacterized protein DFJ58DRAFT_846254 [Suillus subalutaceus]KAG1837975.1 hypothetical protein DFJ58DRAFT_846254 [Suillus subalutaceus]
MTQKANHCKKAVILSNAINEACKAYQEESCICVAPTSRRDSFICQDAIMKKYKLSKKKIAINHNNYEQKIDETYSIVLEGWMCGKIQNPRKINHCADLVMLLNTLVNEHCLWIQLIKEQVDGEPFPPKCASGGRDNCTNKV